MSNIILLVSIERLKSPEFGFDNNLEQNYIISNIVKAQKLLIKPLVGDDKYNELITYVQELKNNKNFPKNEGFDLLIDEYIAPAIAFYIKSEIVFDVANKIKNQPNFSEKFEDLVMVSKKYLNDSDAFLNLLKNHLCRTNVKIENNIEPKGCDLFLGGKNHKRNNNNNKTRHF